MLGLLVPLARILDDHELEPLHGAQPLFEDGAGGDGIEEGLVVHRLGIDHVVVGHSVEEGRLRKVEEDCSGYM